MFWSRAASWGSVAAWNLERWLRLCSGVLLLACLTSAGEPLACEFPSHCSPSFCPPAVWGMTGERPRQEQHIVCMGPTVSSDALSASQEHLGRDKRFWQRPHFSTSSEISVFLQTGQVIPLHPLWASSREAVSTCLQLDHCRLQVLRFRQLTIFKQHV